MLIEYTCADGSRTVARWPSLALLYWLGRSFPPPVIENPEPFKLYVVSRPIPADDDDLFLTLVYAEVERRWNKSPPFEIIPPDDDAEHGGAAYQARCLDVLRWLHAEGDITELVITEEP
jgi:hypothetical protein